MVSVQTESRHFSVEEGSEQRRSHQVRGGKRRTEGDEEGTDGCLQFADDSKDVGVVTGDDTDDADDRFHDSFDGGYEPSKKAVVATFVTFLAAAKEGPRDDDSGRSHGSASEDREDSGETHRD